MTGENTWESLEYVVIDVEGNGAKPPELVELAIVPIVAGEIGPARSWLVRPPSPISWQARRVHGISTADVSDKPAFIEVADEVQDALAAAVPVGHNVRIDLDVLTRSLPGWTPSEAFDTLRLARKAWPLPSHRLGVLVEHRNLADGLPSDLQPHRATYDALVTARLFIDLARHSATTPLTVTSLRDGGGLDLTPKPAFDDEPSLFD